MNENAQNDWQQQYRSREDQSSAVYQAAQKSAHAIWQSIQYLREGVTRETSETQQMGQTFFRLLSEKLQLGQRTDPPSPEEVRQALHQLQDVGKLTFFVSFSLLPGGGALLIALEILARKMGISWFSFVPSSFQPPDDSPTES